MALEFNGTSQYGSVADIASLDITPDISMLGWIYPHTYGFVVGPNRFGRIVRKGATYDLLVTDQAAQPETFYSNIGASTYADDNSIVLNTWQHIAYTHDGTNDRFYVDGATKGVVANANAIPTNNDALIIANYDAGGLDRWFDGLIWDLRLYNRILSLAEIQSVYHGNGADKITDGLVLRMLMNEKPDGQTSAGADAMIDISKEGNHGTPTNSPVYRQSQLKLASPLIS